ncbi:hypothetical protein V8G54_020463 [Vigna mungo]|uniref:Integrase catalytic domain-containing protein n=1 Tax=Vigna mungo TaxID=3915 RepID=A0AAQ3NDV7_VIGMU
MAHTLSAGLLQPLPILEQIWDDIAMDFTIGLPSSSGFTVILVVIDRLSKYAHFPPIKVAEVFVKMVVKLHGILKMIVSDRDKVFLSHFWKQLFKLSGTSLHMSIAYHPQTGGQSEALNKFLEMYLRCFTHDTPKDWTRLLPWAEFWYNTSYNHSCGMSPFKIVNGQDPPTLPYRQHFVALYKNQKLSMRFFGPFPVIERIGQVAYKLLLPSTTKIHLVFHCSQLKLCKGDHSQSYVSLPITHIDVQPVIQPVEILQSKVPQHLVKWEGLDSHHATWEDQFTLQQAFPDFNLEGKVGLNGVFDVAPDDIVSNTERQMTSAPNDIVRCTPNDILSSRDRTTDASCTLNDILSNREEGRELRRGTCQRHIK